MVRIWGGRGACLRKERATRWRRDLSSPPFCDTSAEDPALKKQQDNLCVIITTTTLFVGNDGLTMRGNFGDKKSFSQADDILAVIYVLVAV